METTDTSTLNPPVDPPINPPVDPPVKPIDGSTQSPAQSAQPDLSVGQPAVHTEPTAAGEGSATETKTEGPGAEDTFQDVVESGDINDINVEQPTRSQLDQLINKIKKMNPHQRSQLMANLSQRDEVNPNNNDYSSMSKKDLLKERMRRRLQGMKSSRSVRPSKAELTSGGSSGSNRRRKKAPPSKSAPVLQEVQGLEQVLDASTEDSDSAPEPTLDVVSN